MRRFQLVLALLVLVGCDKEKSGAEKRAEEMAAANASASAAAKASAAVPDPKEQEYAARRKTLKDRATAHMAALEKLYVEPTEANQKAFRDFFPATKEGEKDADDTSKEAVTAAKNTKMTIKKWEIADLNFDAAQTTGTTDISVEELQAGGKVSRCVVYKLDWKESSGSFRRVARRDFRIVPCS